MIDLGAFCCEALAMVETVATSCGVELPERRCVVPGSPASAAWDCASVLVGLETLEPGMADTSGQGSGVTGPSAMAWTFPRASVSIMIVRACVPTVDGRLRVPTAEAVTEAGLITMADATVLVRACTKLAQPSPLYANRRTVTVGLVDTRGPQGGHAATVATMVVSGE